MYCGNNFGATSGNNDNNFNNNRMKVSTFPPSRSSGQTVRDNLKEIQLKRKTLMTLENTLKTKIDELRELCLKEGEITGQLPIDYPLQPREPLPQIRQRDRSKNNPLHVISSNHCRTTSENTWQRSKSQQDNNIVNSGPSVMKPPSSSASTDNLEQQRHNHLDMNIQGVGKFQPYYEETKPFQMSDFYRYSSKHRNGALVSGSCKTTRQLQEEVKRKQSRDGPNLDDRIMASMRIIERNDQELMKATAEAMAFNPELANRLKHIVHTSANQA